MSVESKRDIGTNEAPKSVEQRSTTLLTEVRKITESRLDHAVNSSLERLVNALNNSFRPYLEENLSLADQISSSKFTKFSEKVEKFLDTSAGFIFCVDGRIHVLAFGVPRAEEFTRRPSGMPLTRTSTEYSHQEEEPVLNDPDLAAAINIKAQERRKTGRKTNLVEFITYHIHSKHPDHGCGAEIELALQQGHSIEVGMRHGRIKEWFKRLGNNFESFNVNAKRAKGEGTTFDIVHDAYTDGLIFGLREAADDFDPSMTLEENLLQKAAEGKILMTELLDESFGAAIFEEASKLGKVRLDLKDPNQFSENVITIGEIAMKLTKDAEERGFNIIPDTIRKDKPNYAKRALVFTAFFNTVYRMLGRIEKGKNELEEHPEKLVSIGPIGALVNRTSIAFQHIIPAGELHHEDVETAQFLHRLNGKVAKELAEKGLGLDLTQQGRIIVVTGKFNPDIYIDEKTKLRELEKIKSTVKNNAAKLRCIFEPSVRTGETIIFAVIHDERSREIIGVA